MINNRRSEIEIINEILTLAKNGVRKTRILYQTNLSYTQLQNYLSFLLEANILEMENFKTVKTYRTTPKGLEIMESINKVINGLVP